MIVWLPITIGYALVAMVSLRMIAGHLAWWFGENSVYGKRAPGGEHWMGAILLALLLAPIWPVAVIFLAWPYRIGAERRVERELERKQAAKRIKELEKQLDL